MGFRLNQTAINYLWPFTLCVCLRLQYHALGLLYHLRKNDRLAVTKMLNKFTKSGLKSPFAYCMLIRIASKLLDETEGGWVACSHLIHYDTWVLYTVQLFSYRCYLFPLVILVFQTKYVLQIVMMARWTLFFFYLHIYSHDSPLFDFIESCLRNKNEMVVYEAASAIVHMPNCTARELAPAVSGQYLPTSYPLFMFHIAVSLCIAD